MPPSDPPEQTAAFALAILAQEVKKQGDALHRIEKFLTGNGEPTTGLIFRMAASEEREAAAKADNDRRNVRVNAWITAAITAAITALIGLGLKFITTGTQARASDHQNASK